MADESREDRHNRELIELFNELRVALPGVQVLFAFLLVVPFANGFPKLGKLDRDIFFVAFIATALSTVLLIAPSSYHRLRWRQHDKERLLVSLQQADDRRAGLFSLSRSRAPCS